jgi:hypothetical protein
MVMFAAECGGETFSVLANGAAAPAGYTVR